MASAARASGPETPKAGTDIPTFANLTNRSATAFTLLPATGQPGPIIARHWWRASEMEAPNV